MGRLKDFNTYMLEVATNTKSIKHSEQEKHYFRFNMMELAKSMGSRVEFPAIGVETSDFTLKAGDDDGIFLDRGIGFIIINQVQQPDDFDAIETIYDDCLEIVMDVLGKIHKDKNCERPEVYNFDFDGLNIQPIGPVFTNCYGWRVESGSKEPSHIQYDASKFENETEPDYKYK